MERTNIEKIIGIYKIGDGYAIAKDGSITVGFRLTLPEYDTLSHSDFRSGEADGSGMNLQYVLERAIKDLDEGYIFHQQDIVYYAPQELPHYDNYITKTINRMYSERRWLSCKTYLFITKRNNAALQGEYSSEAIAKIVGVIKRFRASLAQFSPVRMEDTDWLEYLRDFFSLQGECNYDLNFQNRKFGDMQMTGISVNADFNIKSPMTTVRNTKTSSSQSQRYNSLVSPICWDVPCYKILNNVIYRENPQIIRKQVQSFGATISILGKAVLPNVEAAESIVSEIEKGDYAPCHHHFNTFFIYPETDKTVVEDQLDAALEKMQLKPTKLSLDFEHIFMASIGGCASAFQFPLDMYPTFINEVVAFSNLETTYAQSRGGVVLADTHGKPCVVDIFNAAMKNSLITNRNFTEYGPSGTGKSVTANKEVASLIQTEEYFNFILDDGESYEMLHHLMGDKSRYMRLTPTGDELSFNPFLIPLIDPKNDPDKTLTPELEVLTSLVLLLWDPENGLNMKKDPNKIAYITKLLSNFYADRFEKKLEYVNFNSFFDYVRQQEASSKLNKKYFDFDSFELVLQKFYKAGAWEHLLNGQSNSLHISSQLRMCVVELKALSEVKAIYKIVLYLIMLMAKKVLADAATKYKIFWIDEAWKLLDDPYFGDFIKYLYKTIRKEDSGIGLIVQDVNDIIHSEHAAAIINNSDTMFFLSHEGKEADLIKYQNALSLTARDLEIILSVKKADHAICIKQGNSIKEYLVKLSPEELALYSTSKEHKAIMRSYLERYNGNMQMALNAFCEAEREAAKI